MKIRHITPKLIKVKVGQSHERLHGCVLMAIFLSLYYFTMIQHTIICHEKSFRTAKDCRLVSTMGVFYHSKVKLGSLTNSYVQPYISPEGDTGIFYGVVLETGGGLVNLKSFPTPGFLSKKRVSDDINYYVGRSESDRLKLKNPIAFWLRGIIAFMALFGFFLVAKTDVVYILIDKEKHKISITWKNLFRSKIKHIEISKIKTVDVETTLNKHGNRRYRLSFKLKDGEVLPFSSSYNHFFAYKKMVAEKLNRFMDIQNIIKKGTPVKGSQRHRVIWAFYVIIFVVFMYIAY